MEFWELEYNGDRRGFADWGLALPKLSRRSLAPDEMTMSHLADFDGPELFAFDSLVTIYRDGARYFEGRVQDPSRHGTTLQESVDYLLHNGWADLEDITFEQTYKVNGGAGEATKSRVVLGQAANGTASTNAEQIEEILNYAIANGANLQMGTIEAPLKPPFDQRSCITCAEAFRLAVRWHPDGGTVVDYSTSPPTIHFKLRASKTALALAYGPDVQILGGIELSPCYRNQRPAFIVKYERENDIDGEILTDIIYDIAPVGFAGPTRRVPICTIDLVGAIRTVTKQEVKVRDIKDSNGGAETEETKRYWRLLIEALQSRDSNGFLPTFTFEDLPEAPAGTKFSRQLADPDGEDGEGLYILDEDGETKIRVDLGLGKQLIEGAIAPWMEPDIKGQYQILRANIRIGTNDPVQYGVRILATNASSRTYTDYNSTPGQSTPEGLAQAMYDASKNLEYAGQLLLIAEEAGGVVDLGNVVNLSGGRPEWETMRAIIHGIDEDFETGQTVISIGPPTYLSPQDMQAALAVTKPGRMGQVGTLGDGPSRDSGQGDETRTSELGTKTPAQSSSFLPNGAPPFTAEVVIRNRANREIWVRPFTVNGVTPTIGGSPLQALLDGTTPFLTLGSTALSIYGQADADVDKNITSVSLHSSNSDELPEDTDTTAYFRVASTTVFEGALVAVSNTIDYSLNIQWCGGSWSKNAGA